MYEKVFMTGGEVMDRNMETEVENKIQEHEGSRQRKLAVISFTKKGFLMGCKVQKLCLEHGDECWNYAREKFWQQQDDLSLELEKTGQMKVFEGSLEQWTQDRFSNCDGLIFIGAAGIAVRAIAPYVKDKFQDPAVVVVDELGQFVIPLLSGHVGGANELALNLAEGLGAVPVITTATDCNHVFAVDVFAGKHGMVIGDRIMAKQISADLLAGKNVGFQCDFPVEGTMPAGLAEMADQDSQVWVTWKSSMEALKQSQGGFLESGVLKLIPPSVVLGIGCKKNTPKEKIEEIVSDALRQADIDLRSVCEIRSIDLKKDEAGLIAYAVKLGVPFHTMTAEQLLEVPGEFHESEFVRQTTGVGNVCERSALSRGGRLICGKYAKDGVTVSAALLPWKLNWGE